MEKKPIRFGTDTYQSLADHHAYVVEALSTELRLMMEDRDRFRAAYLELKNSLAKRKPRGGKVSQNETPVSE